MSTNHIALDNARLDIMALLRSFLRALPKIIIFSIIIVALTYAVLMAIPTRYTSVAQLLVEEVNNPYLREARNGAQQPLQQPADPAAVASHIAVIKSLEFAKKVIDRMNLSADAAFVEPSLFDRLLSGEKSSEELVEKFKKGLSVHQVNKTRVIAISYSAANPKLAADIANTIAQLYSQERIATKTGNTAQAVKWLEDEISKLRVRVTEEEAKLNAFKAKHDIFDAQNNTNLQSQELTSLSNQITRAASESAAARARANAVKELLRSGAPLTANQDVQRSVIVQRLVERKVGVSTQLAQLSATLLPNHPRIQSLNSQLRDYEQQIQREAREVVRSLEAEATIAQSRVQTLKEELSASKSNIASQSGNMASMKALEREATAQRDLLNQYLSRYRDAMARNQERVHPSDLRIVSHAGPNVSSKSPKKAPILLSVGLASLVLASLYVIMMELFSGSAFIIDVSQSVQRDEGEEQVTASRAQEHSDVHAQSHSEEHSEVHSKIHAKESGEAGQPIMVNETTNSRAPAQQQSAKFQPQPQPQPQKPAQAMEPSNSSLWFEPKQPINSSKANEYEQPHSDFESFNEFVQEDNHSTKQAHQFVQGGTERDMDSRFEQAYSPEKTVDQSKAEPAHASSLEDSDNNINEWDAVEIWNDICQRKDHRKTILVGSTEENRQALELASELVQELDRRNATLLVMNTEYGDSSLSPMFNLKTGIGFSEWLSDQATLKDALAYRPGDRRLAYMQPGLMSSEGCISNVELVNAKFRELTSRFDYILIHSGAFTSEDMIVALGDNIALAAFVAPNIRFDYDADELAESIMRTGVMDAFILYGDDVRAA